MIEKLKNKNSKEGEKTYVIQDKEELLGKSFLMVFKEVFFLTVLISCSHFCWKHNRQK